MKQQTLSTEQVADAEHIERTGAGLLVPRAVVAQPDTGHIAADVDCLADAAIIAPHRAADHQEQGYPIVARSSR